MVSNRGLLALLMLPLLLSFYPSRAGRGWLIGARVVSVYVESPRDIPDMTKLKEQGVSVIELDVNLNYESSFYGDRSQKLELIKEVVKRAHAQGLKVVVYVPSLEVISDKVLKWVQRSLDGRPVAVSWREADFFWLEEGEYSNWMSPLSLHREKVKELLIDLEKAGVDGIWLDVPHMPSYLSEDKEDLWPDASTWGLKDFRLKYGHDPPKELKGPAFWDWMEWRHQVVAEYLKYLTSSVKVPVLVESSATDWGNELAFEPSLYGGYQVPEVGPPDCNQGFRGANFTIWSHFVAQLKYVRSSSEVMIPLTYGADPVDSGRQLGIVLSIADGFFETNADCYMTGTVGEGFRKKAFKLVWALSGVKKSTAKVALVFSYRLRDRVDTYVYGPYDMTDTKYMAEYRKAVEELLRKGIQFDVIPEERPGYEVLIRPRDKPPFYEFNLKGENTGGLIHLNFSLNGCLVDMWDNVLGLSGSRKFGLVFSFDDWSLKNASKYPKTFYLSFSNLTNSSLTVKGAIYIAPSPVDRAGLKNSSLSTTFIFVGGPAVNWWPYPFSLGKAIYGKEDEALILVKGCGNFRFVWAGGLTRYGTRAALLWLSSREVGPTTHLIWKDLNGDGKVELDEVRGVKA